LTTVDTDGAPRMVVWGALGTPRHEDGSRVITPRLYDRLSPLERMMYSGDPLTERLAARVSWLTGGEPIDGWDPEDFVSYGLERASGYPEVTRAAVSTWVHRKIIERRRRTGMIRFEELDDHDRPADDYRPTRLPEDISDRLDELLPLRQAQALRLYAEGLTPTEATGTVGISRNKFYEAIDTLRGHLG
jgi:DNA-directed RNA polymerase specialized sigma24 family protein